MQIIQIYLEKVVNGWDVTTIEFWSFIVIALTAPAAVATLVVESIRRSNEDMRRRIENAVNLADYYAEKIIPLANILYRKFINGDLRYKTLQEIKTKDLTLFDEVEFSNISPELQQNWQCIYNAPRLSQIEEVRRELDQMQHKTFKTKEAKRRENVKKRELEVMEEHRAWCSSSFRLLNRLEYFSMQLMSGVADEETLYQSLHMSFIDTVGVLYYQIADKNKTSRDKYYTNIIGLFNKWRFKQAKDEERENKVRAKDIRKTMKNPLDNARRRKKWQKKMKNEEKKLDKELRNRMD